MHVTFIKDNNNHKRMNSPIKEYTPGLNFSRAKYKLLDDTTIYSKDGDIVKGINIARYHQKAFIRLEKQGYIRLKLISPKPNKKYEVYLTDLGKQKQTELHRFIQQDFREYAREINCFREDLKKFNLL